MSVAREAGLPSVTVVLPNRNHGHYIGEALAALLPQLGEDDELIVFDDASTDDSVARIMAILDARSGARLVRNAERLGVIANLNRGLAEARGTYVYFAAADDRVAPGFLDKSRNLFARFPQAGICSALVRKIDAKGRVLGVIPTPLPSVREGYLPPERAAEVLLREGEWAVGSGTVYARDALKAIGGFHEELGSFCDGFAAQLLGIRHGACFLPEPLANWRRQAEGYATRTAVDPSIGQAVADAAVALMRGPYRADFPKGYPEKWLRRWLFGNHRVLLSARYGTTIGWLLSIPSFLRHRAGDLPAVAARRLGYFWRRIRA